VQLTLDGQTTLEANIERSIAIMREFVPPEGYYLACSFGKDSVALLRVAQLAGVKYDAHYSMTTIDPPELTRFGQREFPEVAWEKPKRNFFNGVRANGLPTRTCRWCCKELKEVGGVGRRVLIGIRAEESAARARRGVYAPCNRSRKWFVSPILHWSEADVWAFHEREGLPHCSLYDEGWSRIGCVCCPFESQVERSMERWAGMWRAVRRALDDYYARSEASQARWPDAEAMWQWWIHRERAYPLPVGERPPTLSFEELSL
jgi:phosphoadenosine phosphosulfate reductase